MNYKVDIGEIVYCDLIVRHNDKDVKLKKVVYKNDGNKFFYNRRNLEILKIKEPVLIKEIKIISRLGYENKSTKYTEVKRSEEKRNNITGAYE